LAVGHVRDDDYREHWDMTNVQHDANKPETHCCASVGDLHDMDFVTR